MSNLGVITDIRVQKKNKNRVSIFLDGEYSFSLDMINALKLKAGMEIDSETLNKLKKDDLPKKAYSDGLYFLSFRSRTSHETFEYLEEKGYPLEIIEKTLEKLKSLGFVDDENYAKQFIETKLRINPKGSFALRYELENRGIDPSDIEKALKGYNEFDAAKKTVEKKIWKWKKLPEDKIKNKIYTFLSTRGFSYDITKDVTEKILSEDNL